MEIEKNLDLSIIIVNYNTFYHLQECLESLINYTKGIAFEVIIVDNNSNDRKNLEQLVNFRNSNVKIFFLEKNNGFGYGCNYGAQKSKGNYLLFLNPDIKIKNNAVLEMLNFVNKNNIGICSGLLTNENGKPQYCFNNFPGIKWEFMEAFGVNLSGTINNLLNHKNIISNVRKEFEVDWVHGACLMISSDLFREIKGFDERIFLYYEDVDLCKRVNEKGFKNFCLPFSCFIHFERSSVRDIDGLKKYYFYMNKSKLYYMAKYHNHFYVFVIRTLFVLGMLLRIMRLPFWSKYKKIKKQKLEHFLLVISVHTGIYSFLNIFKRHLDTNS